MPRRTAAGIDRDKRSRETDPRRPYQYGQRRLQVQYITIDVNSQKRGKEHQRNRS